MVAASWAEDGRLPGGGIVATIMSNLGLERYLGGLGLTLARTKVGDRYVVEHMRAHGYNVGGEQSGHIILSDYCDHRRRPRRGAAGAGGGAAAGRPVSEVCRRFEPVPQILKNVRYGGGKPLDDARGQDARSPRARPARHGNGRLVIRPSGTEPVIRVMAEGDDETVVTVGGG